MGQCRGTLPEPHPFGGWYGVLHVTLFHGLSVGGRLGAQVYLTPAGWDGQTLLATTDEPPTEAVIRRIIGEAQGKLQRLVDALKPSELG